jgi:hypothetical protein
MAPHNFGALVYQYEVGDLGILEDHPHYRTRSSLLWRMLQWGQDGCLRTWLELPIIM